MRKRFPTPRAIPYNIISKYFNFKLKINVINGSFLWHKVYCKSNDYKIVKNFGHG